MSWLASPSPSPSVAGDGWWGFENATCGGKVGHGKVVFMICDDGWILESMTWWASGWRAATAEKFMKGGFYLNVSKPFWTKS